LRAVAPALPVASRDRPAGGFGCEPGSHRQAG